MATVSGVATTPVDQRLAHIRDKICQSDRCDTSEPGNKHLLHLLDNYLNPKVNQDGIDFLRGVLRVYRESETDEQYQKFVGDKLTQDERERLERFVDGDKAVEAGKDFVIPHSIGVRDELQPLHQVNKAVISQAKPLFRMRSSSDLNTNIELKSAHENGFTRFIHKLAAFLFDHKHQDEIKVWDNVEFQNWGKTVSFTPRYTVWPRNVSGVFNIVKFAVKENLSVRCSGYRHSWSPIFGENGQILISMIDPDVVSALPNTVSLPLSESKPTELESIDILPDNTFQVSPGKTLVRVGAACTNERLRRWCVQNNKVTIPFNVIMVEITLGGSNAPICHGAGRAHRTLSDLVRCVEYVDCNGKLQTVLDKNQLRAASGAFGLLGVVTHITFEFDPMSYAQLAPKKLPAAIAIPPPDNYEIPPVLRINRTPEERQRDIAAFEKACESSYYTEWFWFPYAEEVWVNVWDTTTDSSDVVDFPSPANIFVQWAGTVLMNISQYSNVLDTVGHAIGVDFVGTTIISRAAMWNLGDKATKTYVTDGLHFQRAIQNVRVRDMEVEMAIPAKPGTSQSNWDVCRRAWWDAMNVAFRHHDTEPQRMPLEMRIMGDSDVIMSPQRGNKFGTCSIEVLTLESQRDCWLEYCQEVLDKWMSYTDADGKALEVRPHWSKEWMGLNVGGRPWRDVLKDEYRDEVKEFKDVLTQIGQKQGWKLDDLRKRFGNAWFDELIFDN